MHAEVAVAENRREDARCRHERLPRGALCVAGEHPRDGGGEEHHSGAHAIRSEEVGDLQELDPVIRGVPEAAHREAGEQMAAGEFQAQPDERRCESERHAVAMDGDAREPDECRRIEGEVEGEGEPTEARGRMGKTEPVNRAKPEDKPGEPERAVRMRAGEGFAAGEPEPADGADEDERPGADGGQG